MSRAMPISIVIVDELADVIRELKDEIAGPLGVIAQKGREYDLHLVAIVPKATKAVLLNDMLHTNAGTVLIGTKMNSSHLAQWGTGVGGLGLEKLAGSGHAKVKLGPEITEIQIALPDNIDVYKKGGGEIYKGDSMLPITVDYLESVPIGGGISKSGLRRFASVSGCGIGYSEVTRQFEMLIDQGYVKQKSKYRAGERKR